MTPDKIKRKNTRGGLWIILVAAAALEAISCTMYFTSRAAIRHEAEQRAKTELRRAELEIDVHAIEMETAAKGLAKLAEKHINQPDSIFSATRLAVSMLCTNTSMAVAYVPDYFPGRGKYFEACSSRISEDSIYTRQIGSDRHDYTQMEWWQNGFVHDSCWWCEPYLDNSGSQAMVVSCSCPVRDKNGKVVAVVCIDMSLAELDNLTDYLQVYPNSYYSIRSSSGVEIVPAPDTVAGRKYNIFDREVDATGWHLEIIIPEEELFRDLNYVGRIVGLLMLLGSRQYMDANFDQGVTVAQAAQYVFLSQGYFTRAFVHEMGMSPMNYLMKKRIERACSLLENNEIKVSAISLQSGFSSPQRFNVAFRKLMGMTPMEYRKRHLK